MYCISFLPRSISHTRLPTTLDLMGSDLKNKGGKKAWTTEEQKKWLMDNLAAYVASRSTEAPSEFWPPIYEDWFAKWPVTVAEGETGDKEELLASGMNKRKEVSKFGRCFFSTILTLSSLSSKSGTGSKIIKARADRWGQGEAGFSISQESSRKSGNCREHMHTRSCTSKARSSPSSRRGGGRSTLRHIPD